MKPFTIWIKPITVTFRHESGWGPTMYTGPDALGWPIKYIGIMNEEGMSMHFGLIGIGRLYEIKRYE